MTDIKVPRELAKRLADKCAFLNDTRKAQDELRALLSAPTDTQRLSDGYDPKRCLACGGDHGQSGLSCPNMRVTAASDEPQRCPKCGYTKKDCRELMDHRLCGEPEPAPACLTCGDSGWIGGPSYSQPDEGGEPCPDCNSAPAPEVVERPFVKKEICPACEHQFESSANPYIAELRAALSERQGGELTGAARDVLTERTRQVTAEGCTAEHDDEHDQGDLAAAASAYALFAADELNPYSQGYGTYRDEPPEMWPWHEGLCGRGEGPEKTKPAWWKPTAPRHALVKAGALILAEIERLDRAALSATQQEKSE